MTPDQLREMLKDTTVTDVVVCISLKGTYKVKRAELIAHPEIDGAKVIAIETGEETAY